MIIGKNYDTSHALATKIQGREVIKFYLCLVEGYFPNGDDDNGSNIIPVFCDQPIGTIDAKLGLQAVLSEGQGGKIARTAFIRIAWKPTDARKHHMEAEKKSKASLNGTSILLCRIYTGRTHQIRVHLQYLGKSFVYIFLMDAKNGS
ncbi:unnamed protein product [Protopolystoma xenopodis]|uniref:Pseudouridine synthase RsuA/RluA-like domain-containing protein n=1 Tax=Protopolystoma xenopodis TaxID=117903 RepID=A0A448X9X2_9PLAT|nr:unnamed protein product [Protopolystoma xenopodis]